MSDIKVNANKHKSKTIKCAKKEEVTCWNCFTVNDSDTDKDLEPIPLPKVREKHREKLKVYSFLASELSKPKAVPLKQKVSEHYAIGKKIDEKISSQVSAECVSADNYDTSNDKNDIRDESETKKYVSNKNVDFYENNQLSYQNQINVEYSSRNKTEPSEIIKNNIEEKESKHLSTDDENISRIQEHVSEKSIVQVNEHSEMKTTLIKNTKHWDLDKKVCEEISINVKSEDCVTNKVSKTKLPELISLLAPSNEEMNKTDHNSTKKSPVINTHKSGEREKSFENNITSNEIETKALDTTEHEIYESVLEKLSKLSISNSNDTNENTTPLKTDLIIQQQISPSTEVVSKNKSSAINAHKEETNKIKQSEPLQNIYKRNEIKTMFTNVLDMKRNSKISIGTSLPPMTSQKRLKKFSNKSLSVQSPIICDGKQDTIIPSIGPSKLDSPMTIKVFKTREITKLSPPLVTKAIERKSIEKRSSQKLSTYRDVEKDENNVESSFDNIVVQKHKTTNIFPVNDKKDDKLTSIRANKTILCPSSEKKSIALSTSTRAESMNTKIPILQKPVSSKYSPVQILRNKAKHYLTRNSSSASDKLSPTFIRSLSIKNYVNQENKQTSSSMKGGLEYSACENIENANILFKVPINTSTPKEKCSKTNDTLSESESNQTSLEIASNIKNDNASSNGSESGYAGSSATVQDLPGDENNSKNIDEDTKDTDETDNNDLPHLSEYFKSSITSLNIINNKKPLQTSTMSLNTTSKKSPVKSLRWSTLSIAPRSITFEDEVYMSEAMSSPGHATLPRRSNSPLPNERDLDRDRFPINRSGLQARSESMASVYSGAGEGLRGSVTVRGEVQFSLVYNYRLGALEVGVKRCRDLAPIDVKRNRSDPYVKVYLLPDKSKAGKRKTKVKKNTLSPVFEETLTFTQPLSSLSSRTLWLSVWHADMFGRNDFLGEVTLPLADVVFDDPAPMWYKLHERTEQFDEQQGSRGDLIIGLKFELQDAARGKGTLHVLVKEAKNLVATKPNGLADVFCKSYLLPERGRLTKQKTSVCRRTLHPRWEHTFTYRGVGARELATRALELSLWDRDRIASNDFMGAVRLSLGTGTYMGASVNWMDSVGKEVSLWQTMMQRPNFWVEGSLPLRPQLNN